MTSEMAGGGFLYSLSRDGGVGQSMMYVCILSVYVGETQQLAIK